MNKKKKKSLPMKRSPYSGSIKQRRLRTIDFYDPQSNVGPQKQVDYTLPKSNIMAVFCLKIWNMLLGFLNFIKNVCININIKINININMIQNNNNCQQFFGPVTDSLFIKQNMKNNEKN